MEISVEFKRDLALEEVISEIQLLDSPHILLWYIGTHGLKKSTVKFYKDFILNPVLSRSKQATFWLVDLTAWGAFRDAKLKISKFSSFVKIIENFKHPSIKCIKSSDILKQLLALENQDVIEYFKISLKKEFIARQSLDKKNIGITLREMLDRDHPLFKPWYDSDVGKCYSIFQYLEAFYLIDNIIEKYNNKNSKEFIILFALPNNEIDYYYDDELSFRKDLNFFLKKKYAENSKDILNSSIVIRFLSFKYGEKPQHRPYNAPGKGFKKKEFSCKDIVEDKLGVI